MNALFILSNIRFGIPTNEPDTVAKKEEEKERKKKKGGWGGWRCKSGYAAFAGVFLRQTEAPDGQDEAPEFSPLA